MKLQKIAYLLIPLTLATSLYFNNIRHPKAILILSATTVIITVLAIYNKKPKLTLLDLFATLFIGISLVSFFTSQTKNVGLDELLMEISAVGLFLALIRSKGWIKHFYFSIIPLVGIESIYGIFQYLGRNETRSAGSFLSQINQANYFPNAFGLFLAMTIPILWLNYSKKLNKFNLFLTFLGTTALLTSFSRGALIAYLVASSLSLLAMLTHKHTKQAISTLLVIVLAFPALYGLNTIRDSRGLEINNIKQKASFTGTEATTSVDERSQFFKGSIELIKKEPLKGYGPNSFTYVYPQVQPLFLANAPHPHNWILKIGLERGLIAAFFLILLAAQVLILFTKHLNKAKKEERMNSIIIFSAISAGLFHNMIDFNLNFASNITIFFLLLAVLVQRSNRLKIKNGLNPTAPIIALIILTLGFTTFKAQFQISRANAHLSNEDKNSAIESLEKSKIPYKDNWILLTNLYEETNQNDKALETALKITRANTHHAFAYNKAGLLSENPTEKLELFEKAINADPKNFFNYYVNYYNALLDNNDFQTISQDSSKILQELTAYTNMAEHNIHYTSQTGNIDEAILLSLFYTKYGNQNYRSEFFAITKLLTTFKKTFNSN